MEPSVNFRIQMLLTQTIIDKNQDHRKVAKDQHQSSQQFIFIQNRTPSLRYLSLRLYQVMFYCQNANRPYVFPSQFFQDSDKIWMLAFIFCTISVPGFLTCVCAIFTMFIDCLASKWCNCFIFLLSLASRRPQQTYNILSK